MLDVTRLRIPSPPPSLQSLTNLQTLCLDHCVLGDIALVGQLRASPALYPNPGKRLSSPAQPAPARKNELRHSLGPTNPGRPKGKSRLSFSPRAVTSEH
ncbi:PREDICTED: disease resistance, partial [Prunus dulcis]